jgi:MYXO-CTERM domain-containing protein
VAGDCDDSEASDHPGASEEVGNEDDENCDGAERCFRDADGDGYRGLLLETVTSADLDCTDAGEAAVGLPGGDCEDEDPAFHPGATEACDDPTDWNCDGSVEYADGDSDGSAACLDCDDQDADAQPGATEEVGDGVDQDCDGGEVCLVDADDDGYVDGAGATVESPDPFCTGTGEALASAPEGDCDDDDAERHPGAAEICDEIDQNCNGEVDEGLATEEWFADADGDGFGDDATAMTGCDQLGDVTTGGDCDDGDSTVFPGAEDLPGDGVDQDCLGGDEVEGEPTPGPGDDGDGTGCANCSVPGESSGVGGLALVLAAVLVLRRRPGRGRR